MRLLAAAAAPARRGGVGSGVTQVAGHDVDVHCVRVRSALVGPLALGSEPPEVLGMSEVRLADLPALLGDRVAHALARQAEFRAPCLNQASHGAASRPVAAFSSVKGLLHGGSASFCLTAGRSQVTLGWPDAFSGGLVGDALGV